MFFLLQRQDQMPTHTKALPNSTHRVVKLFEIEALTDLV